MGFKKDFVWGAATAAYQIEGAYNEDGEVCPYGMYFHINPEKYSIITTVIRLVTTITVFVTI